jgi:hypothetical protein
MCCESYAGRVTRSIRRRCEPHLHDLDAILEFDASVDFGQLVFAFQTASCFGCGGDELEDHELGGLGRQRSFRPHGSVTDRGKHALDRVRRAQVVSVLGGKVEECEQGLAILHQAIVVPGAVFVGELIDRGLGCRACRCPVDLTEVRPHVDLDRERDLVQHVGGFVNPTAQPEFLIVDGAAGLEKAIVAVWNGVPVQRCTVHKHRNLLGHAPERLHEEITADYTDMIYAATAEEIEERRKAFVRKWRLRHRAVADSLEEAGDALFAFTRLPPSQWRSARTSNAIERLHEEFKRRIKTQTVLPSADTAAMLFWALLASGQINMRKVDGWQTLTTKVIDRVPGLDPGIDLAA